MRKNIGIEFLTVCGILLGNQLKHVNCISCYVFDSSNANASSTVQIASGCSECRKYYSKFELALGRYVVTEQWQCERGSEKATQCPRLEQITVNYNQDGSQESRKCSCCTDFCNKLDQNFCGEKNIWVRKIKSLVEIGNNDEPEGSVGSSLGQHGSHSVPSRKCYVASDVRANLRGFDAGTLEMARRSISFAELAEVNEKCKGCKKTSFTAYNAEGKLTYDKNDWECISSLSSGPGADRGPCKAQVTATISADGKSLWRATCTCCHDQCNDESFCTLNSLASYEYSNNDDSDEFEDDIAMTTPPRFTNLISSAVNTPAIPLSGNRRAKPMVVFAEKPGLISASVTSSEQTDDDHGHGNSAPASAKSSKLQIGPQDTRNSVHPESHGHGKSKAKSRHHSCVFISLETYITLFMFINYLMAN